MKIGDIPFSLEDYTNGIQYFIPSLTLYLLKIYKTYETERNWDQEELKDELKALIYRKYV